MKRVIVLSLFAAFLQKIIFSQSLPKTLPAKRTAAKIKIDGLLDEPAWKDASAALDFTEFTPTPFRKEDPANLTEAYLLYNDEGIYLAGYCHERTKDSIVCELNGRDGFGNNDFIGFIFDTYMDKLNGFEYFVTPLGEQWDSKVAPQPNGNDEDFTWNAVWKSAAAIHDDGWSFELFIPFSAIRFSKKKVQDWGFNISRRRQKSGQQNAWNPVDVKVKGFLTQEGFLTGLENIKPPLRLQFSPYFSTYVNHYPFNQPGTNNWTSSVNGGMDVKYGISQAITLDMTLIPDFGQVQSDNRVLNLSPFEVKFNENRPFFTEGVEFFTKGNLFYSRRIGGTPLHFNELPNLINNNEQVIKNPTETKLINATKISGRFQNGLGIGFFNAITSAQHALVEDDVKNQRKIQTSPLTNYNISVLNQSLKYNSSVTVINTNVWRSGSDYDANVTAALFDLNNKKNMWNIGGKLARSSLIGWLPGGKNEIGYNPSLYFGKTSGKFNFNVTEELIDDKFNSNDFGYFTNNNYISHALSLTYHWVEPKSWYNNIHLSLNSLYLQRYKPFGYQGANFNVNTFAQLKNLWQVVGFAGFEPESNNFYEPRVPGRVFRGWSAVISGGSLRTNSTKKYWISSDLLFISRNLFDGKRYQFGLNQNLRFNRKLSVRLTINLEPQTNNVGFADTIGNDIIFGRRDVKTVENTFNLKYSFNDKMVFTARVRHYWSEVDYKEYFTLLQNGELEKNNSYSGNANQNYNVLTVDAVYTWQFAPGSFLNLVWKNNTTTFDQITDHAYFKNFDNTMSSPQNNNLSVKVIYFLDYLDFKRWIKKR